MEIITLVGATGTGKSRHVWSNYSDDEVYSLPHQKNSGLYWAGYDYQRVVLIDEMYGNRFAYGQLLTLIDCHPRMVSDYGCHLTFNSHVIFFCSNSHPRDWYDSEKHPWDDSALERRLTTGLSRIYNVDPGGVFTLLQGEDHPMPHECGRYPLLNPVNEYE